MTPNRRLGEREITPIGLGCMQFAGTGIGFYPPVPQDEVDAIVAAALKGGVTWFDSAEMYGNGASERALTTALHGLGVAPGDVLIASKWTPFGRTARSIEATAPRRLAALQGYPLDLHQIHAPYGSLSSVARQIEAMARLYEAGTIGGVGVSNFGAADLERTHAMLSARGIPLLSNQVQVNLVHRTLEHDGVLTTARRLGVTLIASAPLRAGLLTGKFHDEPSRVRSLRGSRRLIAGGRYGFSPRALEHTRPLVEELRAVAEAHGATPTQVALAWLVTYYDDTVVAIPGASKVRHAQEAAAAGDLVLSSRELDALADVSNRLLRSR
jgi:aryl-alcohol dehydrogenase-like predicted oxidoreductase